LQFVAMKFVSQTGEMPAATVTLRVDGVEESATSTGDGVVDASFQAVDGAFPTDNTLLLYSVNAITAGSDSQGEVSVRLQSGGRIVNGQGADTDIVMASVKAYINALNKLELPPRRFHPQSEGTV
ncbi:MAG: alpha-isopropylmalate synthase regulatory domain-containing protein, partial [Arenicellales bacterium]|nr:alpha-isopropylmalate synthase regulatory domain-containing protein [Arenicellales bacterium]